jgi:structural maintenance of chromosome 2
VYPALSLIEYDPAVHAAMQWVFGQTFICKDMETAKKITFHDRILKKSVTLDGDVFDPSGTLSGGKHLYFPF